MLIVSLRQESYEFKSSVAYIVNSRSLPVLKIVVIKIKRNLLYAPVCTTVFLWLAISNTVRTPDLRGLIEGSVEQICSALSEAKCKPETWTLRNTTVSALMKTVWCSFATFSREIHYYVNDWGEGCSPGCPGICCIDQAGLELTRTFCLCWD